MVANEINLHMSREELRVFCESDYFVMVKQAMGLSFNAVLIQCYTAEIARTQEVRPSQWKTFKQWQAAGYCVKKGEKGFRFWSSPKYGVKDDNGKWVYYDPSKEDVEGASEIWGTCILFNENQVSPV